PRDPLPEGRKAPIPETGVRRQRGGAMDRLHEADDAVLDHAGREAEGVGLERVPREGLAGIDPRAAPVRSQVPPQQAGYESLPIRIVQVQEMPGMVESEPVPAERTREPSGSPAFLDDQTGHPRVQLAQVIGR